MDKGSDCGAQGHGFESSLRWSFKVSRLNNWRNWPFLSRAHKSLNFDILTIFFLLNCIDQQYIKIERNSKLINFLVKYTIRYHPLLKHYSLNVFDFDPAKIRNQLWKFGAKIGWLFTPKSVFNVTWEVNSQGIE